MQSKSLLIAIAAFAVTTTGVHAYGGSKVLSRAGLSDDQITAIEEARELKKAGDEDAARDLLLDAGITEDTLRNIYRAVKEHRAEVKEAVKDGDWNEFRELVQDGPLGDIITTEVDFELFQEAQALRASGDWEEAEEILEELGIDHEPKHWHHKAKKRHILSQLTEEQRDAFRSAREANDKETMKAIFEEAGIERGSR